jgi:hypothetical protein
MWCGGGHLNKVCPEKENASSTPVCCNCQLVEGEKPRPANYWGCRHAKKELQMKKSQRSPKPTTERVFSSNLIIPGVSFAAALRGITSQGQRPLIRQLPVAVPPAATKSSIRSVSSGSKRKQSNPRQYIESGDCSTANYDRVQWCCVRRRQNSGHHQNCIKADETEWLLEFIVTSKSQHLMRTALGGSAMSSVNSCKNDT